MSRITSIIFDLDGTLYNSSKLAAEISRVALHGLALQLGIDPNEAQQRLTRVKAELTGRSGNETTLSAGCLELGADLKELHGYLAAQVSPEQFLLRDEQVVALLRRLGENYRLYLYTNNNLALTTRIMRLTGIDGLFTTVFTVEDFWRAKPDRLALAKIYAAIGAEAEECLFVGDRYDVDLRLPEEHGSMVFMTATVAELLTLEEFCNNL